MASILLYDACISDWRRKWSSIAHDLTKTLNHHGCFTLQECFSATLFSSLPRANLLNNTSGTRIKQEKWIGCEEIARKFESFRSRSEKMIVLL